VNDLELSLRRPADPAPAPSSTQPAEPPGPVPAPAPRRRGAFPARPSSSAVGEQKNRTATADPLTVMVANVLGKDLAASTAVLERLGGLAGLAHASEADLTASRIPKPRARLVRASFELARMSIGRRPTIGERLSCGGDVWLHMRARLSGLPVEEFWLIALNVRHYVLADELCARGSLTGVEVHPRDVFRRLIALGAAAVIFCHNHPTGDPAPSRADLELTGRLREVGELCGIPVLDHVVVAATGHVSIADRGWR
jgi:DNA repair protein RadC